MSPANFAQNPHHIIATAAFPPLGSLEHDIQHTGQKNKKTFQLHALNSNSYSFTQ